MTGTRIQMTFGETVTKDAASKLNRELIIEKGFKNEDSKSVSSKITESMAVSVKAGISASFFGADAGVSYEYNKSSATSAEMADTKSFSKSYSGSEKISFSAPISPHSGYAPYTIGSQLFIDEAGILSIGMFVDNINENATLWRELYSKSPDVALVLSNRFTYDDGEWKALDDKWNALKIRGLRVKSAADSKFNDNKILMPGVKYVITVPLYNASFNPVNGRIDVPVKLSYQKNMRDDTRVLIETTTIRIGGWKAQTEINKATATFEWTVPKDMDESVAYQFCVEVDPDNRVAELHEGWDIKNDPGGNNLGYCRFSVWDGSGGNGNPTNAFMSGRQSDGGGGDTDTASPFRIVRKSQNVETAEINAADAETGAFNYITLQHVDDKPLYNVHCLIGINDTDEAGSERLKVIGNWHIPGMFPDDTEELFIRHSYDELMKAAENGKLELVIENPEEKITYVFSPSDFENLAPETNAGVGSSSGGCDVGLVGVGILLALAVLMKKR